MIIGVTGTLSSGKSLVVEKLIERGFTYIRGSEVVRDEAKKLDLPIDRKAFQELGNARRAEFGVGYWAEKMIAKMEKGKNYVVDGIRNPGEIEALKKFDNFFLIGVDAPIANRLQWILGRNKDSDPKTIEEIEAVDARDRGVGEAEHGQQSMRCYEMADVYIQNDGTFEELAEKIGNLLEDLKC